MITGPLLKLKITLSRPGQGYIKLELIQKNLLGNEGTKRLICNTLTVDLPGKGGRRGGGCPIVPHSNPLCIGVQRAQRWSALERKLHDEEESSENVSDANRRAGGLDF